MSNDKPSRHIQFWDTIAVTALPPGWVNIWRNADGTEYIEPCPAMLLQECRERSIVWDVPQPDGTTKIRSQDIKETQPYETRVVYAQSEPDSASIVDIDNYAGYLRTEYRAPDSGILCALRNAVLDGNESRALSIAALVWGAEPDRPAPTIGNVAHRTVEEKN